ncbi:MAG TPA: aldolase/citrate lyase family protein [Sporichthya sp.]|nr:aldolase/citrate lyase family protein [Sporichthya sp.]
MNLRIRRSCLVVPGHAGRMHASAANSPADEVVFDLEDAVAADAKDAARDRVVATLLAPEWATRAVAVRINGLDTRHAAADLVALSALGRPGFSVVLPKAENPGAIAAVRSALPGVAVQALIETPAGLLGAAELAAADGVDALILGYADLAAGLGRRGPVDPSRWLVAQELLLAAAHAAGVDVIDGPFFGLGDAAGLNAAVRSAREAGFDGKWAIHPEQVAPINDGFAAGADELRWAASVTAALEEAAATGSAAARVDGAMVDEAMARRARRIAALPPRAEQPQGRTSAGVEAVAEVGPPYFDDLSVGDVFGAPGMTLTSGHAALHQAIVGDRLRLALDAPLFEAVTGTPGVLAHPSLVCDVAIGQSTAPSGRVLGNLFYRGLAARPVAVGATLRTRTEVVALKSASRGRGVVALRCTTTDEAGSPVLDFWRCPLLPGRPRESGESEAPVHNDDLAAVGRPVDVLALVPKDWDLAPLREAPLGPLFASLQPGSHSIVAGETVTSAPELARLTLNTAMTHTDASAGAHGRRLVYGGHVIAIAAGHVTRLLPDLATVLAWHSCDHTGPTFEGDLLRTVVTLEKLEPLGNDVQAGGLVHFRAKTSALSPENEAVRDVLDWSAVGLMP